MAPASVWLPSVTTVLFGIWFAAKQSIHGRWTAATTFVVAGSVVIALLLALIQWLRWRASEAEREALEHQRARELELQRPPAPPRRPVEPPAVVDPYRSAPVRPLRLVRPERQVGAPKAPSPRDADDGPAILR